MVCGGDDADDLLWPHASEHIACEGGAAHSIHITHSPCSLKEHCKSSSGLYSDFLVSAFYHLVKMKIYTGLLPFHQFVNVCLSCSLHTHTHIRIAPSAVSTSLIFFFFLFFPISHYTYSPCSRSRLLCLIDDTMHVIVEEPSFVILLWFAESTSSTKMIPE